MNSLSAEEEFSENLQEGRLAQLGERLVYTQPRRSRPGEIMGLSDFLCRCGLS